MKSKYNRRLLYTVYVHGALFLIGLLAMFLGLAAEVIYPGNESVPIGVFRSVASERINMSAMWLMLLMIHAVMVYGYYLYRKRRQNQHERFVYDDVAVRQPDYTRLQDTAAQSERENQPVQYLRQQKQ